MAVLWFAREGIDSTIGFAAYDLPLKTIITNLGGERNQFQVTQYGFWRSLA
jgi:hypothetical protein